MARAIGLRVYKLSINEKGNRDRTLALDDGALHLPFYAFVSEFLDENIVANSETEMERTWFFEKDPNSKELDVFGHVHYGTYGFESNFKNNKTKKLNYRRKTTDVEEIPLYFQFVFPGGKNYALVVFQSFQGRSCVQIVLDRLKERFESLNSDLHLRTSKLMPSDAKGSIYNALPVKKLRLIKRNTSSDLADVHHGKAPSTVDVVLTVSARRSKSLGSFKAVASSVQHDGVIIYDGIEFEQAIADIRIGNKTRPVGLFGDHSNAGVIDISESVVWGDDGHPTLESIRKEAKSILKDFIATMPGKTE